MKKLKMTLEFEVQASKASLFSKELIKRMHKFLALHVVSAMCNTWPFEERTSE